MPGWALTREQLKSAQDVLSVCDLTDTIGIVTGLDAAHRSTFSV